MITAREYSTPELAEAQFNAAIDLYLAGDYVPAITLAEAAEELFGGPFAPNGSGLTGTLAVRSDALDDEGRAFSILDRVFKNRILKSWDRFGCGPHPRMGEVDAMHHKALQRTEAAARVAQPSPTPARDPQNAVREHTRRP